MKRAILSIAILLVASGAMWAQGPQAGRRGPQAMNPGSVAARLLRATPEERQRYLENLPPQRRERIQQQLAWFDSLPPEQQEVQIRRAERFAELPPERRVAVREQLLAFNQLPPRRKAAVRRALVVLRSLGPRQRVNRMNSPAFRLRFSEDERRIIVSLCENLMPPR
jgi:hypothetical protein